MTEQFILGASEEPRVSRIDFEKELNDEQKRAVLGGDGACLVLAGAGSGKTRTITYRVAYLIDQGISPDRILLLTFTNKSAHEMRERVERLLGSSVAGIWAGTFHSIAHRILRANGDRIGLDRSFTIMDADDAKSAVKLSLKDMHVDGSSKKFPSPSTCLDILSYTRNVCGTIQGTLEIKYPHLLDLEPTFTELASRYADRKRRTNALDFDDLLTNLHLLLEHQEAGTALASKFQYVLVDEYQDTNALQARIVNRFASVHGNAFVVGDDAQSIYAFRGADIQNILQFPYEYPNAKTFSLVTNYRSTPQILDIANDSLRHNVDQFKKDLIGLKEKGSKPHVVACSSAKEEAQYVAERILSLQKAGSALQDIAVLFRATSHSQQLEMELLKRDISYEYRGGLKIFERAHIKDVLAFLRAYQNPKDEQAWARVLLMRPGVGAAGAEKMIAQLPLDAGIENVINVSPAMFGAKASSAWAWIQAVLVGMAKDARPSAMIRAIASSDYQDDLEREYPNWRDRLDDIEQFALFAESYEDLATFLGDVLLYDDVFTAKEASAKGYGSNRIVLSTIHQAKGLEWDSIFIIHLADGMFPNARAVAVENGLEEERRLFYVAVTRARKYLSMSYPLTVGYDVLKLNRPSEFIDEIDAHLYERVELVSAFHRPAPRPSSWSWDGGEAGYEDDVIEVDAQGNRRSPSPKSHRASSELAGTKTVWKKK